MHELGIMTSVLDAVQEAALQSGATRILKVDLKVGEMTEAIVDALEFAFGTLKELPEYSLCAEADLNVTMVKPRSRCHECGAEFQHDRFHLLCPECGSFATKLLEGREMEITSIEVDLPDDGEESADGAVRSE